MSDQNEYDDEADDEVDDEIDDEEDDEDDIGIDDTITPGNDEAYNHRLCLQCVCRTLLLEGKRRNFTRKIQVHVETSSAC